MSQKSCDTVDFGTESDFSNYVPNLLFFLKISSAPMIL